jgi:hypothetical protein
LGRWYEFIDSASKMKLRGLFVEGGEKVVDADKTKIPVKKGNAYRCRFE